MQTNLPKDTTLKQLQEFVMQMKKDFGFYKDDPYMEIIGLTEELGELTKAVRKNRKGSQIAEASSVGSIGEEVADVLIYLTQVANLSGVDIEKELRKKHERNKKRIWNQIS